MWIHLQNHLMRFKTFVSDLNWALGRWRMACSHSAAPLHNSLLLWGLRHPEPSHAKKAVRRAARGAGTLDLEAVEDLDSCAPFPGSQSQTAGAQEDPGSLAKTLLVEDGPHVFPSLLQSAVRKMLVSLESFAIWQNGWFSDGALVL